MRAKLEDARPSLASAFKINIFTTLPLLLLGTVFIAIAAASFQSHLQAYEAFSLRIAQPSYLELIHNEEFPSVALVTMSDNKFLNCSLQLVRSVRNEGSWRFPIFLLTAGLEDGDAADPHHQHTLEMLSELQDDFGVILVPTSGALDSWAGRLSVVKLRKMDIFFNPLFRTYDRIIYMDPDGIVNAPLLPLVLMKLPLDISIAMRQNDESMGKGRLWSEANGELLLDKVGTTEAKEMLSSYAPDRQKVGGSCWFIAEMSRMRTVQNLLQESRMTLCRYRDIFRYNDQTLLNILFYDEMEIFPWCASREVTVLDGGTCKLREYCQKEMRVQRLLDQGLKFIYRHCSVEEKSNCLDMKSNASGKNLGVVRAKEKIDSCH